MTAFLRRPSILDPVRLPCPRNLSVTPLWGSVVYNFKIVPLLFLQTTLGFKTPHDPPWLALKRLTFKGNFFLPKQPHDFPPSAFFLNPPLPIQLGFQRVRDRSPQALFPNQALVFHTLSGSAYTTPPVKLLPGEPRRWTVPTPLFPRTSITGKSSFCSEIFPNACLRTHPHKSSLAE